MTTDAHARRQLAFPFLFVSGCVFLVRFTQGRRTLPAAFLHPVRAFSIGDAGAQRKRKATN
jgi:hypothetical protein